MDTVAFRDVSPSVLGSDGGISLVIAVKLPRPHENHVGNRFECRASPHSDLQNFGTVRNNPWPKITFSHLPVKGL